MQKKKFKEEVLGFLIEVSELADKTKNTDYRDEKMTSYNHVLLEIYIEGFHCILSIGNHLGINDKFLFYKYTTINNIQIESFLDVYGKAIHFNEEPSILNYIELFTLYLSLGSAFNFTQNEIEETYLEKYVQ
ncbi:dUTP diphosphatase (plasmid) [Bacillus mycoides]|nr:dUTP diphosphatase [Bacillus mycoides]